MKIDPASRRLALQYLAASAHRVSAAELERHLSQTLGEDRKTCRRLIRRLVALGDLAYTYEFGSSYLERSYFRPVRLSRRFIRIPPEIDSSPPAGSFNLRLVPGSAFGCGRHPTTRLALQAIESVFERGTAVDSVLDVGTGSGVLLVAAVRLGARQGLGIDIDACARVEAAENVRINGLTDRIGIGATPVETLANHGLSYRLVIANLRTPSLLELRTSLATVLQPQGDLILSGIHCDEIVRLVEAYADNGLSRVWQAAEKGWCTVVLRQRFGFTPAARPESDICSAAAAGEAYRRGQDAAFPPLLHQ